MVLDLCSEVTDDVDTGCVPISAYLFVAAGALFG